MKYPKKYTYPVLIDYAEAELIEGERIEDKVRRLMDEKKSYQRRSSNHIH